MYDFDPDEYVQTIIQQQVEYRMAKATANLAIGISLILLFMCGGMGAMLVTTAVRSNEPIITRQPN